MTDMLMPNAPDGTATDTNAVPSFDSIAAKMDAMRQQTLRNQIRTTEQTETGETAEAVAESPVAPDGESQPEVAEPDTQLADAAVEAVAPEDENLEVTADDTTNSSDDELIDFIDFAETNPRAKFKFMKNGKEMIIDAKRAAAILGQGGAIHEEARQLKIERSEFDEYLKETRARQEGLVLAMEFTVEPRLQQAYDEIVRTQGYQTTFQQQLARATDPAEQARIRASMDQNERYIAQVGQTLQQLKPAVDQFRQIRSQQVREVLDNSRKSFRDKELKNEYVFNELREKLSSAWPEAQRETIPGVKNIDLISSDETLLSLVRDGLKYRNRPVTRASGTSAAVLTNKKNTIPNNRAQEDINKLREQAKGGDKKAADNLLVAQLSKLRAARTGR
jgi:hypothetical protein